LEAYNRKEFFLADSLISLAISYDQKNNVQDYLKFYNRGVIRKDMDSVNSAISDFTSSLKLYPNFYEALENRAVCYYTYKNLDFALEDIIKALVIRPADTEGTLLKCLINFDLKEYEDIILDCSKALQKKKDPRIYGMRSIASCMLKKYDNAKKDLAMGFYYFNKDHPQLLEAEIFYTYAIGKDVCALSPKINLLLNLDWHYIIRDDVFIEKVKSCASE
jgi:tetratricopeptide (TPR) repeat protein